MSCKNLKDICVGEFVHKITVQEPIRDADGQGGWTTTWTMYVQAWAKIVPLKAQQILFAQQLQHQISHKITCRYFVGLRAEMRILFDGRIFHIREIRNLDEANRFFEIIAWENKQS